MTTSIRNCTFAFRCTQHWDTLKKTRNKDIRFCKDCEREVYYCHTDDDLVEAIKLNRCVAIEMGTPGDDYEMPTIGVPSFTPSD